MKEYLNQSIVFWIIIIFLNMKLLSKLFLTSLICVLSCSSEETEETACVDETKIDGLVLCIEVYEPVCGCNGITYPNVCLSLIHISEPTRP